MELVVDRKAGALGGCLLVAGCCMGAGMIGLPAVTALSGFIPSVFAMAICYFFATSTGLLLMEAALWFEDKVSLFSIAHFALGTFGKVVTLALFLFLYYCLFVAYIDGGGQIFASALGILFGQALSREVGITVCLIVIAAVTYAGTRVSDLINRYLVAGLAASFILLALLGISEVKAENISYGNWKAVLGTMPILLVCFGYQNIVPSLTFYLRKNVEKIRFAIIVGNLIPFAVYCLWNFIILGLLPSPGPNGFPDSNGKVIELLQSIADTDLIFLLVSLFSFFALFSSVLPNAISFMDFIGDGIKRLPLSAASKHLLCLGVFLVPPALFSFISPDLFLKALSMAGGLADVLLLGILPVAVIWIGRYVKKIEAPYTLAGGKPMLIVILLLSLFFLVISN